MTEARTAVIGDHEVSRIGLGTNRLTGTAGNRDFLASAVQAGVRLIDTAHLYRGGESERAIGSALAPFAGGLVVATKGGYHSGRPERIRAEIEQSLESLRTESIALWYLHKVDEEIPLEETLGAVGELVEAGRIEHVGLSQVSMEQLERGSSVVPIAAVQNEYNLGERGCDGIIDHCEAIGIAFVPFFPLGGGKSGQLEPLARRYGVTPQQIKLAWLLRRSPAVLPIPGTLDIGHLRENLAALDLELSAEDYAALWPLSRPA